MKYYILIFTNLVLMFCYYYDGKTLQKIDINNADITSKVHHNIYLSNQYNSSIVKQPIIAGKVKNCNFAEIRILDYNTGNSINKEIILEQNLELTDGFYIKLKKCHKDIKNIFNPVSMAFILIVKNNKIIYEGWIFSQNTAISLPRIENKFIYLNNCNCINH